MIYPKNFEQKIGFDRLREILKANCKGIPGRAFVDRMRFTDKADVIARFLGQTDEFRRIISSGDDFPDSHFNDLTEYAGKAMALGNFLTENEFDTVRKTLKTCFACHDFFLKNKESYPLLADTAEGLTFNRQILRDIDRILDEDGTMRDNASPKLHELRMKIISAQSSLRRQLDTLLRSLKSQNLVADDAALTLRDGRMVIPVPAENKRTVKGFIHDTSATGKTVFTEPQQALEINNEIREAEYEEHRERMRILVELTDKLRPEIPSLKAAGRFLGMTDFVRAKALFAIKSRAIVPKISEKPGFRWDNARHPLLEISLAEQGRNIVPLGIKCDETDRILLISGPNAGGKSVSLKTTGIVQYMFQCGLPIPADEASECGVFSSIFIDIGDEQSLDNDLSTYSSHLKNMKHFLLQSDGATLCLIDEFGTGTDPQFGGAIAEAVLEDLNDRQVYGVITTHYTNLKIFAENTPGITNAAMRYDTEELEPLFQLEIGRPGSSFALEIAKKIGLPRTTVKKAREMLGRDKVDMEKLLRDLEAEKKDFYQKNREMREREKTLQVLSNDYKKKREEFSEKRREWMQKAREEAKELLADANSRIEQTIREIKEQKAAKTETKKVREDLDQFRKKLEKDERSNRPPKPVVKAEPTEDLSGPITEGCFVRVTGSEALAQVVKITKNEAVLLIGELRSTVKMKRLRRVSRKQFRTAVPEKTSAPSMNINIMDKSAGFSPELDLRGQRGEEALSNLEDFLDDAVLLSYTNLRILHGKGDGILRELVRIRLGKFKPVSQFNDEHADFGGAGITVVKLK